MHQPSEPSGVDKFVSRRPTCRAHNLLARPIGQTKNGRLKPNCTSDQDTTRNIAFCSLLPKQDLQLSF